MDPVPATGARDRCADHKRGHACDCCRRFFSLLPLGIQPLRNALGRVVSEPAIAFAERDWLLVSDFANQTGDPVFDRSLNTALSAALTQSRYVNVVPSIPHPRKPAADGKGRPHAHG